MAGASYAWNRLRLVQTRHHERNEVETCQVFIDDDKQLSQAGVDGRRMLTRARNLTGLGRNDQQALTTDLIVAEVRKNR
jgi:hypothetical protein